MKHTNNLTREQLIEYSRLRQKKKDSQLNLKLTDEEKETYSALAKEKGVTESELARQGLFKSLYRFVGIKQDRE
jgi:uncharacterized membrane protein